MADRKEQTISALKTLEDWRVERGWVSGRGAEGVIRALAHAVMNELSVHNVISGDVKQGMSRLTISEDHYQQYVLATANL